MRLGLAAKLSLLAALLVFGTTVTSGWFFFRGARTVVRGREVAALRDEADLRRRELLADLDRAPADLLALTDTPAARAAVARTPADPVARGQLAQAAARLLADRPHYLELALVDADLREAARVERTADGPQPAPPAALRSWQGRAEPALTTGLTPPAVGFSEVRAGGPGGPPLVQVLATPVVGPDARPAGWAFLRLDFTALAARLNESPRLLGFLVNARGEYLAHPDPARVLGGPADAPLDKALARLTARTVDPAAPADGEHLDDLALPGLTVYAAAARFAPPDADQLAKAREALLRKYPGLRVGRGDDPPGRLALRAGDADVIHQALHDLPGLLHMRVESDGPYRCETYFARLVPVRTEVPPWLGLAVATAHEEVEHDIVTDYWHNFLVSALLAAGAGGGMFAFALFLTGPLRRMTAYAERVAAGQESDVELPAAGGRDEIATLARAFRRMVEQVRGRTRELRESEARIRTILNTAAEGIVTIDESGRLESFNQAAERIFGYPAAEVRGEHFRKLLYRGRPGEAGSAAEDVATLLGVPPLTVDSGGGGESSLMSISRVNGTTRDVTGRRRNGQPFPVEMSVSEVVLGDRLVYTAILRDVTDRKQAEAQIRRMTGELEQRVRERTAELVQANQSLESARDLALEANRAKDAFLAVMGHELRTPLNAIIGYCDYWLHEADDHDPHEMLDDLRKMHVSGKHLLALINDALDLAKIQAGKMMLKVGAFDLLPLLEELREWVEPLVRKNGNALSVEAGPALGAMRADRSRVR